MGIKLLSEVAETSKVYLPFVDINATTIVFTLINTLIIFLLYRFLLHEKVMTILEKRKEAINAEMQAAEDAKKAADDAKAEYVQRLEKSKEEAGEIVAAAVKKASAREAEIIAEAEQSAQRIKERAEESIAQEKKRALNEVKDQISEVVVLAASRICEKEISEKENQELIDSFLVNVGK